MYKTQIRTVIKSYWCWQCKLGLHLPVMSPIILSISHFCAVSFALVDV